MENQVAGKKTVHMGFYFDPLAADALRGILAKEKETDSSASMSKIVRALILREERRINAA